MLVACGGDSGGGSGSGDPLPAPEATTLCQTFCEHAVSCGWLTNGAGCPADCETSSSLFRSDGFRNWLECEVAAACSTPNVGEACYLDAVADTSARPVHDDYTSQCTAVPTACPGVTLPTHVCDLDEVVLFSDPYMTTHVMPCFELGCSQVSACLETNVLDAF